jgi:hypothetical protein
VLPSCSLSARTLGRDVVFRIELAELSDLRLRLRRLDDSDLEPMMWLEGEACGAFNSRELLCSANPDTEVQEVYLSARPAGIYHLWVSGQYTTEGEFELEVQRLPPPPLPGNEACDTAEALSFDDGGVARARGNTVRARNDTALLEDGGVREADGGISPTCDPRVPASGPDVLYSYELESEQDVTVKATGARGFVPLIYARVADACASPLASSERGCNLGGALRLARQPPGRYHLWIDGADGAAGGFELEVKRATPLVPPANDTCAAPQLIEFPAGATRATVAFDPTPARDDPASTCNRTTDSREGVFLLRLTALQDVRIRTSGEAGDPVLYVRKGDCAAGEQLGCEDESPGTPEEVLLHGQSPGDYFIFVEGYGTSGHAPVELTVQLEPPTLAPANETCATARELQLPALGVLGSTAATSNDYGHSCGTSQAQSGGDVVYAFTTHAAGRLHAAVTPSRAEPTLMPYLYLRDSLASCAAKDAAGSRGCSVAEQPGGAGRLQISSLPAGRHFLVVDGHRGTTGPFQLDLWMEPALSPAAAACGNPEVLHLTGGAARAISSTAGGGAAMTLTCSAGSAHSPERLFRFTSDPLPPGATGWSARVRASSLNALELVPAVSLQRSCGGDLLACGKAYLAPHAATVTAHGLLPGTDHFVWIDSAQPAGGSGPFELSVELAPSPAPNDGCAGAVPLPLGLSLAGTTLGARADVDACAAELPGPEVVYAFTAPSTGEFVVTVVPQPGFDAAVVLLDSCAANGCGSASDAALTGGAEQITLEAVAGQRYLVGVDSYAAPADSEGRGGFVISVGYP